MEDMNGVCMPPRYFGQCNNTGCTNEAVAEREIPARVVMASGSVKATKKLCQSCADQADRFEQ